MLFERCYSKIGRDLLSKTNDISISSVKSTWTTLHRYNYAGSFTFLDVQGPWTVPKLLARVRKPA